MIIIILLYAKKYMQNMYAKIKNAKYICKKNYALAPVAPFCPCSINVPGQHFALFKEKVLSTHAFM